MKWLQRQQKHTGTYNLDYLNISACLIFIIYNTIDFIVKDIPIYIYLGYILPYIIYPIISIILKKNIITAILYIIVGLLTISLDPINSSISGLVYIFFAYNEIKTNKFALILTALSSIALSIRFILLNTLGSEAIVSILLFVFIFASFYFKVIYPYNKSIKQKPEPKPITRNIDVINITQEEKAILKLYCRGKTYEEISRLLTLNVVPSTIRRKIKSIMEDYNIKNTAHFGKWLFEIA